MVAEVMPPDLAVVVRQAVRKRLRLREQEQPDVLVGVAGQQHGLGGLNVLDPVGHVGDPGGATLTIHLDLGHMGARHDSEVACRLRTRDRRDERTVLRVDVTPALGAEPVVHAR